MTRWQQMAAAAVVLAAVASAQAQRPGGGRGMQQPLHVLALSNADLQKELKVTDDQKKSLKDVTDKVDALAKKRAELFTGGGFDREKMQELQKEAEELATEAKAATDKAFTDDQKKRIKQIDVQRMGPGAFANADVVKDLKLTDDQQKKFKDLGDEYNKARGELRQEYGIGGGGGQPDPEKMAEYTKKSATLATETLEKAKKELTADQQATWKELVGEPFDVSKLQVRPMRRDN